MFLQRKIHFIGIGGIGMSAIAKILFQKGFKISGSDQNENQIVRVLEYRRNKMGTIGYFNGKNLVENQLSVN